MNSEDVLKAIPFALVVVILIYRVYKAKLRDEMLARQAEKRGGEFSRGVLGGWGSSSELRLPFKGNIVRIYSVQGGKNRSPQTCSEMKFSTPTLTNLEVWRNDPSQKIIDMFGKERIMTDDEEFDRLYVIRGDDPLVARRVFAPALRQRLTEQGVRAQYVRINPTLFKISILGIPNSEEDYDIFIDTVFLALKNLQLP